MIGHPLPAALYLDTSIFVAATIRGAPHYASCSAFCRRLVVAETHVYFSQLVRIEFLQAVRRLATTQHNLAPAMRASYQLDRWGVNVGVRRKWLERGMAGLEAFLKWLPIAIEVSWTVATWQASAQIMIQHGLQASDALHVATAQEHGLSALAAVDADYRRVPALDFWLIRD